MMQRRAGPKSLVLILARDLASRLATPVFLVDAEGTLVYFNEAAEAVLGRTFAESGEMQAQEWADAFSPTDEGGAAIPLDELPLGIALARRIPSHRRFSIRGADDAVRTLSVTALPLTTHLDELDGAIALFWEEPAG
jgi:PAS domain-containing protein